MPTCKRCHSTHTVKHGFVRQKQRYQCKNCGYEFVEGDQRSTPKVHPALKVLAQLLCLCGLSFNLIAKLLKVSNSSVQCWFDRFCEDEMRTFPVLRRGLPRRAKVFTCRRQGEAA